MLRGRFYFSAVIVIIVVLLCGLSLVHAKSKPKPPEPGAIESLPPQIFFDRGDGGRSARTKAPRSFGPSEDCSSTPCIVTQHGAWQFPPDVVGRYAIRMGFVHENHYHPIELFQESTTLEQKMAERLLNRSPNRKAINLMHALESGKVTTVYAYGLLLQNDIKEGDLIAISLTDTKDPLQVTDYFYRFHRTGLVPDFDFTLLYPINFYHPNPGDQVQGTYGGAAFSFSVGTNMDPGKKNNWFVKGLRAVRLNLFMGLLTRKELANIPAGTIVQDKLDGFVGMGFTFFEFLNAGYGVNLVRSPHTFFPFVGLEVKHVYEFFRSLKPDTHSRWVRYMKEEAARGNTIPSQPSP
jgi:hypothetical protein